MLTFTSEGKRIKPHEVGHIIVGIIKNGVEDLKKAKQYIDFLIEKEVAKKDKS